MIRRSTDTIALLALIVAVFAVGYSAGGLTFHLQRKHDIQSACYGLDRSLEAPLDIQKHYVPGHPPESQVKPIPQGAPVQHRQRPLT